MYTRFVIAGTGRSGTTWIYDVLNAAGLRCGHEDVFRSGGYSELWEYGTKDGVVTHFGDASMYAAPELHRFSGPVLHQVRHPLDTIGSLLGWRLLDIEENRHGDGWRWVHQHFQAIGDELVDCVRYWCQWNLMCERGGLYLRYRVEDVDWGFVYRLARFVDHPLTEEACRRAVEDCRGRDYSAVAARGDLFERVKVDWNDIPASYRVRCQRQAERYGYEI